MLTRVNNNIDLLTPETEDEFLNDLVSSRLGVGVTREEVASLVEKADIVNKLKEKITPDMPNNSKERLEYGVALNLFRNFTTDLKSKEVQTLFEKLKNPSDYKSFIIKTAGTLKSLTSSFDNSFFGRQGLVYASTHPIEWTKLLVKSFSDIAKEIKGVNTQDLVKADIYSRKNAINGKYDAMDLAIGIKTEEAYPSSLPTKIPVLGRLFKASEAAYNNAALRMRADWADNLIENLEKTGVNMSNKAEAKPIGAVINSATGRGSLGGLEPVADKLNVLFFSPRFLAANFDVLTAHIFRKDMTPTARKIAATNLLKMIGTMGSALTMANLISQGSVELDPRSSDFGLIKIGNLKVDITGGKKSILNLAARTVPTIYKGEMAWWTKSANTGKIYKLNEGGYGKQTVNDVITNFAMGKLSPTFGVLRDVFNGETYGGEKVTPKTLIKNAVLPLPIQNVNEILNSPANEQVLLGIILDGLGLSTKPIKK
jgi:hypothetical protein